MNLMKTSFLCPGTHHSGVWRALHVCDVWLQVVLWLLPGRQSGLQTAPDGCPCAVPQRRWWSLLPEARCETLPLTLSLCERCVLILLPRLLHYFHSFPSSSGSTLAERGSLGDVARRAHRLPRGAFPVRRRLHGSSVQSVRPSRFRAPGGPEGGLRHQQH